MARRRRDVLDTMPEWNPTDLVRMDTGAACRGMLLEAPFDFPLPDVWVEVERDFPVEHLVEEPTDNPRIVRKRVVKGTERRTVREVSVRGGCVRGPAMSWLVALDGGGYCVLPREACMGREAFEAARAVKAAPADAPAAPIG